MHALCCSGTLLPHNWSCLSWLAALRIEKVLRRIFAGEGDLGVKFF